MPVRKIRVEQVPVANPFFRFSSHLVGNSGADSILRERQSNLTDIGQVFDSAMPRAHGSWSNGAAVCSVCRNLNVCRHNSNSDEISLKETNSVPDIGSR